MEIDYSHFAVIDTGIKTNLSWRLLIDIPEEGWIVHLLKCCDYKDSSEEYINV